MVPSPQLTLIRGAALGAVILLLGACAAPTASAPGPAAAAPGAARPAVPAAAPAPVVLPEAFESEDFVVTLAKEGDTAARLAERFLGDPAKAWMIEDYNQTATFAPGKEVVIPRRPWNLSGVEPAGYQLVPVLCYHNLGPQAKGRLVIAAKTFEDQMRYLKAQGYRVISLKEFLEFTALKRQVARKTVVLTFDDGWKAFRQYAEPVLKELGFTATLFIYTDFLGSRVAFSWDDIKELAAAGFDIQAHSKSHGDMRRKPGESDAEFSKRLEAELVQPLGIFQRNMGKTPPILAYPYGSHDDEVERRVREAGYVAAFDVRRQGNPSFAQLLAIHRSQIYSEMSLEDFAKNLNTFNQEAIK
jgi:peptidoglycan/xylan/chitin deacetylase (PgdA/CDA1 family)